MRHLRRFAGAPITFDRTRYADIRRPRSMSQNARKRRLYETDELHHYSAKLAEVEPFYSFLAKQKFSLHAFHDGR